MLKYIYIIAFLLFFYSQSFSISIKKISNNVNESGIPFITNYSPSIYESHGQNWAIVQDKNGFIYFGNTDGVVLQYDGVSWRKIPIDNASIVRSLAIDANGVIYVGAQNEFGYLSPDSLGTLHYISLLSETPEEFRNFGDVWQIHFVNGLLHFSTRKYLFRRNENGVYSVWQSENVFHSSFNPKPNQFFIHQRNTGLMALQNDSLVLVPNGEVFKDDWVYVIAPTVNKNLLIASRNSGLFLFDGERITNVNSPAAEWIKTNQVYHGTVLKNNNFALSTLRGGIIILDQDGSILNIIDKESGLQDNQIWFVFQDSQDNIWLALNNGISQIEYPSPWSYFNEASGLEGNVHDIKRSKDEIYAATGMGIYRLAKDKNNPGKNKFNLLKGLKSQSWALLPFNERLLVSCNHGIFEFKNEKFSQISKRSAWQFHVSKTDPNRVFLGLDQGVSSIYYNKGKWIEEDRLHGFNANSRTIAEDEHGRLWIGTVYEGVYRIEFEENLNNVKAIKHFKEDAGLPSSKYNLVFPYKNSIVFGTTKGVFSFNETAETFLPILLTNKYPNNYEAYAIISEDNEGSIWFNADEKLIKLINDSNGNFTAQYKPYLRLPGTSIYTIYPEASGANWLGTPEGIYRFAHPIEKPTGNDFSIQIRRVLSYGDSLIYSGADITKFDSPKLSYTTKAMRFEFASPYFIREKETTYRFQLKGFESDWSSWTKETKKDYTNLPDGKFTFVVQAKNIYGEISPSAQFDFEIQAPLYKRWWAYVLYVLFSLFLLTIFIRKLLDYTRKKTIREQQKIEGTRKIMEEELRSQVAADFHDELGTQITRISLFSEILKNDLIDISESAKNYLEKISQNADNLYSETRDFIWQLDPKNDTLMDFISRIKSFADDLLEETKINFEIIIRIPNAEEIILPMEMRRNLVRIFKEALHNSFKYAQCESIIFELRKEKNEIIFNMSDDGIGFDSTKASNGNGLNNMQSRSKKINGRLNINSSKETGTQINLTVGI